MSNLNSALDYIKRGWKIFPVFYVLKNGTCSCRKQDCRRIGKHPITRNGVQDATDDGQQVLRWWTETPHANIGLATGQDGLIVMDIDDGPKLDSKGNHIGTKVGPTSLQALVDANTTIPETLTIQTGSGGKHFYFFSTREIKNSASQVAKDLDIRGAGGYVILPPSNHHSGGKYKWLRGPDARIADMPDWLEQACLANRQIDISVDIDEKQNEVLKRHLEDKASPELLIRLLYMCGPDGTRFLPPDCDRDAWWQIGAALKKELGDARGWEVWDEWSKGAPNKYDAKTAVVQWNSFRPTEPGATGPIGAGTIIHFAKQNGFRGFNLEAADSAQIKGKFIYAISIKRFVEIDRLLELDKEQFDASFAAEFVRGKPSEHTLRNPDFKRVDGVTYCPGNRERVITEYSHSKLNYWRPSDVTPAPGDVSRFLDHVKYLFPDGEEGDILLDYLAFQVQHPGEKVHWAVLLEGEQGNGKSFFAAVMRLVLGEHNVKMVHNDQLHEAFTHWQRNTQLIIVEEMMARQRLELMNRLKPMITEPWCMIREMYRPAYEQPNRFNFLFFSNHKDALIIDNHDRRYCILKSNAPPHPKANEYYGPLFAWMRRNGPALSHYLLNRPLENFKAKAHAPMTAGKRALILQSMLPIDQFIYDHVEAREYPCIWDLLTTDVMVKPLNDHNLRATPKEIGNAFARLGYSNLGQRRVGDDKLRMWAVRNFETYKAMDASQLRRIWLDQVNGSPSEASEDTVDALYKDRGQNPLTDLKPM